jgi:aldehyde:ferredoxin oxidoreductase
MDKISSFGKIIDIDLSNHHIDTRDFTEDMVLNYLGGFGHNVHSLYANLGKGTDPLGPENIMILSLGLLTGSAAPSSSRVHINALSPLSGLIGSSRRIPGLETPSTRDCLPDHPRRCVGPGVPGHR